MTGNGTPPEPTADQVGTLLSSYENSREQVGTTGYSATYKIVFSPMLVRGFLAKRGLAVVDQPAPTVLLIPVLVDAGAERWWDEATEWAEKSYRDLPSFLLSTGVIAAGHALAGRMERALPAVAQLRILDPLLKTSTLRDWLPIHREQDVAVFAEGLLLAGLPD